MVRWWVGELGGGGEGSCLHRGSYTVANMFFFHQLASKSASGVYCMCSLMVERWREVTAYETTTTRKRAGCVSLAKPGLPPAGQLPGG